MSETVLEVAESGRVKRPDWLRVKLPTGESYRKVREIVGEHKLHTICQSGNCPNMGECWGAGTATFMILGNVCTRSCGFCSVATGRPNEYDADEPRRVAEAIKLMGVKHAVITSVNRDELKDRGAKYKVVAIQKEFSAELPADTDNSNATGEPIFGADMDGSLTMQDAILVRKGSKVKTSNPESGNFENRYEPSVGGIEIPVARGWESVEAKIEGNKKTKGAKFRCSLVKQGRKAGFSGCKSPETYKLKPGRYEFEVKAKADGVTGKPAKAKFKVKG